MNDSPYIYRTEDQQALFDAFWHCLERDGWHQLTLAGIAAHAGLDERGAVIAFGSAQRLALAAMQAVDAAALARLADDLGDAGDADMHERLLEALIQRFESYQPYRRQVEIMARAGIAHPQLAAGMAVQLASVADRILWLCGDHSAGMRRYLRIKGVCAVIIRAAMVWHSDDTSDLSKTMKALDTGLRRAAEWAVSLRILPEYDAQPEDRNETGV